MTSPNLSAEQRQQLKDLLLARQAELHAQMKQNSANLEPPANTAGSVSQDENARLGNIMREVDARLSSFDSEELARIDRALKDMDSGDYGLCNACGCAIPFQRLLVEPMTEHCVPCKSEWEKKQAG